MKYRTVITYKGYFEEFLDEQDPKVQAKILQALRIVEEIEIIPKSHLKHSKAPMGFLNYGLSLAGTSSGYFASSMPASWLSC